MASVWIPLNYPEPVDLSQQTIFPDITVNSVYELRSFLAVDDASIATSSSMDVDDDTSQELPNCSTNNNKSLKLRSFRGASTMSSCSSSVNCPATGCFSSSKNKVSASNSSALYPRRFLSPPDLDNNNSNASDGS
jgi:hypothetical protein